jgi:predicted transcriptional regulator
LINVEVPYHERIDWLDTSNRRNASLFMDLLISITAMNRFQRQQDEKGFYLATEDDFRAAKALFTDKDAEELVKRLTSRERDVIGLLIGSPDGLTRDEIASRLQIAPQRVSQIINGEKGKGGLSQKIPITETRKSESTRVGVGETQTTTYKTVYAIKEYNKFTGFDGVVRLKDDGDGCGRKERKHDERNDERIETDNSGKDERKERKKEKERERGERGE